MDIASIVTDVAIDSGVYKGYDYFSAIMKEWQADLRRWRCSLSSDEVLKLRGTLNGWRCADVTFSVGRVTFADAGRGLESQARSGADALHARSRDHRSPGHRRRDRASEQHHFRNFMGKSARASAKLRPAARTVRGEDACREQDLAIHAS